MERKSLTIGKAYNQPSHLGLVLEGETPTCATKFYMSYTETGLRVRIEAEAVALRSPYEGQSVPVWKGDSVEIFLSPFGKEDWYYEFDFAPNGATFHARIYNPDNGTAYSRANESWNVQGQTQVQNGVWMTEAFIPFVCMVGDMPLAEIKKLPWRFNVFRIADREQEYCSFAPTRAKEINFHVSSAFADLRFE